MSCLVTVFNVIAVSVVVVTLVLAMLRGAGRNDPRCPNCDQPLYVGNRHSQYRSFCKCCGFKERRFKVQPVAEKEGS